MLAETSTSPCPAVILVHYHAPRQVATAMAALEHDLGSSGIAAQWRIVDNGSTPEERAELLSLGLPLVEGGGNHGYAAGVNRGVASTDAETLLLLNPDVVVFPGCVRALLDELARGASVASPRLYWDLERRFLLPPGEERSRLWELLVLAATRSPRWAARARKRMRRTSRRHWEARGSLPSLCLSGAALAVSRAAWERVGPFDERYRLYFEETDWLLRLDAAGLLAHQAPGAAAAHGFAHSTKDEPMASTWFDESARRFRARHYGRWFAALHGRAARVLNRAPAGPRSGADAVTPARWGDETLAHALGARRAADARPAADALWLELSPNREGFPAAGERVLGPELASWRPPFDLMRASGLAGMSLCAVRDDGRELGRWWIDAGTAV